MIKNTFPQDKQYNLLLYTKISIRLMSFPTVLIFVFHVKSDTIYMDFPCCKKIVMNEINEVAKCKNIRE